MEYIHPLKGMEGISSELCYSDLPKIIEIIKLANKNLLDTLDEAQFREKMENNQFAIYWIRNQIMRLGPQRIIFSCQNRKNMIAGAHKLLEKEPDSTVILGNLR